MTTRWMTSIRTKIFSGCVCLTLVTVVVGILSQASQHQLGETARGIYDNAFIPMSYLRSAQSIILNIANDRKAVTRDNASFIDELQSALDALDVSRERAMSAHGETIVKNLEAEVLNLQAALKRSTTPPGEEQFAAIGAIQDKLDVAVAVYAGDGLRFRQSVEDLVARKRTETYLLIAGSIAVALLITLILSQMIVPSIRRAVNIATAIAGGKLDNEISRHGSGETGDLLTALGTMQDSIAEKIAFIETLMRRQASTYAAEMALQNKRFEAALDNMTMGLCMFDRQGALLVHNKRFVEMFALDTPGVSIEAVIARLHDVEGAISRRMNTDSRVSNRSLADGRTIAVSEEAMDGGGLVVTYEDITEQQQAAEHLSYMARHDALTGLPNRVLFREKIASGIDALTPGGMLAVLCLDLDRFKVVNDTLGHPVGDRLLCLAAKRLLDATRPTDTVVRLGGDEFAVICMVDGKLEDIGHLADRLIAMVAKPFTIEGHYVSIGVSIGIAHAGDGMETSDDLLKRADLALYQAKADGRGVYRFFESDMERRIQSKRLLEVAFRAALAEGKLDLHYQPLIDADHGGVVVFEALARWHDPVRGSVPPIDFISIAEETGLIHTLGLWVLDMACREAAKWPDDIKVAINLSPLQFRNPSLVDEVKAALQRSGLPANRLELEITESLMLQDDEATLGMLHEFRALGIRIAMDDFGTGYSSLSYLRRFPFDKIKIDRSFIANMEASEDGLAIVRSLVGLGRSLRMSVVVEGVEKKSQVDLLSDAGCQEMQGYFFCRPQPASDIGAIIGRLKYVPAASKGSPPPGQREPGFVATRDDAREPVPFHTGRRLYLAAALGTALASQANAAEPLHFSPDSDPSRIEWSDLRHVLGAAPELRGRRFGIVLKTMRNEYWRQIAEGYRRRAAIDGLKLDIQSSRNESDPQRQFAIMETMIGSFYDALLISPQSSTNLQPAIEDAALAKLPLVDVNGAVVDSVEHFVGPSHRDVGKRVGQWFVRHYPEGGKVAVVQGLIETYSTIQRTAGFKAALTNKFNVVATIPGNWDRDLSYAVATRILSDTPDLVGIYCNNDTMALGVMEAVKAVHRQDTVRVFGTDGTAEAYASIRAGELTGTVDNFPSLTSDIGLDVAKRLSVGQEVPRVVETPQALVTRETVERYSGDSAKIEKALTEDAAAEHKFASPVPSPRP